MAKVYQLEHVGLGARRDLYETTVRFYEEVFGWHRLRELPGELTFVGDGAGARLEIFPTDSPALAGPHHLAFSVDLDQFDAMRETLRQAGATLDEPYVNEYDDRIGYFIDPAGNRAQIVGRKAPLPK
ncbi:MAG TPA: VOC family protein [Thermomicrobiaceae bacterium]|nr:VOC family protein [Thermomicrobiaceae bacterium]